jgi:hypothetical protein
VDIAASSYVYAMVGPLPDPCKVVWQKQTGPNSKQRIKIVSINNKEQCKCQKHVKPH